LASSLAPLVNGLALHAKTKVLQKQSPARAGLCRISVTLRSDRAAAAITPGESRATATAGHHHDRAFNHHRSRHHHDSGAIGPASALAAAVHAGAASAFGIGRAKARDRGGQQDGCEKVFHVLSRFESPCGVRANLITAI
jgi:hypothetical protein